MYAKRLFVFVSVMMLGILIIGGVNAGMGRQNLTVHLPFLTDQYPPSQSFDVNIIPITAGVDSFTDIVQLGDGRLLIVAKSGMVHIMNDDHSLDPTPFLDLTNEVYNGENESGLLALRPHPEVANNHYFFVMYSRLNAAVTGYEVVVARYTADAAHTQLDLTSREDILIVPKDNPTHNGGSIIFGPNDGYLYISIGDDNIAANSQKLSTLKGKILRVDVDNGLPYSIPADNPFNDDGGAREEPEIWTYGFRNPWRISFDQSGNMYIADVQHLQWEEINFEPADSAGGSNYGWPCWEGNVVFEESYCTDDQTVSPIYTYSHTGGNCAVTGGIVYTGNDFLHWQDEYIFADFCSAELKSLWKHPRGHWITQYLGTIPSGELPVFTATIAEDENGELYLGLFNNSNIIQIVPQPPPFDSVEEAP